MRFAVALPSWALALLLAAVLLLAWAAYARPLTPLHPWRRLTLSALRALTLLLAIACLLRPVRVMPPSGASDRVVPVLVDVSRSMRLDDANGHARIDTAGDLLAGAIVPALAGRFTPEVWTFGDRLARAGEGTLTADAGRSDLSGALRAIRDRYRDRRIPGIIVLSDGGQTGGQDAAATADASAVPVFPVGIGAPALANDLEVTDVAAGQARVAESAVDLTVSAVARGAVTGFDLRVLENGRPIDVRHVMPAMAGSPVQELFTVSPRPDGPTLYTIEIPAVPGEPLLDNNRRSVLVDAPGRARRLLIVEGAPGFEHSFVQRALAADPGLEVDAIVRKGRDAQGHATFFVQAPAARATQLTSGFPLDREALFQYDALVLANIEHDALTRAQFETVSAFVGERGGGLLVLGAKSFGSRGLVDTPIEEVLPIGLADRGSGVVRASADRGAPYRVGVTAEGRVHPVMRIGATPGQTVQRWDAAPALAGAAELGGVRAGAQILAVARTADGARPLVAVQRYAHGRSMVFTGEGSWRWRMQLPATDRTFELFWRQTARWLASGADDPVAIAALAPPAPGDSESLAVDVRDKAFRPVTDAQISMRVILPDGEERELRPTLADARTGRYAAEFRFDGPGVYRVVADARRGATQLGSAERWTLAGGADVEMADPRLNEAVLRRVARATGGQYLRPDDIARLSSLLSPARDPAGAARVQELWHNVWIFAAMVALLSVEWTMRRQWGLR